MTPAESWAVLLGVFVAILVPVATASIALDRRESRRRRRRTMAHRPRRLR